MAIQTVPESPAASLGPLRQIDAGVLDVGCTDVIRSMAELATITEVDGSRRRRPRPGNDGVAES
jgi:hypothetical protein